MTVVATAMKSGETSSSTPAATWRACFHNWPANIPQRGVLVTSFDEQIPFASFLIADEMLFIERKNPDTLGTRSVLIPFANIAAVKIVDPLENKEFRTFGFVGVGEAKMEARPAAATRAASAPRPPIAAT